MKMQKLVRAVGVAGCIAMAIPAIAQDIKLGVVAGMSGPGTSYGIGIKQGAEMAVKEINAAGGIKGRKIALVMVDDASNPAQSVTSMERLVNEPVDLVVGGWGSSQVLANMDVAERAGLPYIVVGATNPKITTDKNKWTFRVIFTDAVQAEQIADAAVKRLGMKRIAVIHDANDYGVGNRDVFLASLKKIGVEPVAVVSYQSADKDFTAQLSRIREANPDGVAIFGTIPAAPAIMNQARDLGVKARFIGTGGLANENLMTLAPKASDGTVLTTYFHEDADAQARAWSDRYVKEFSGSSQPPRPVLAAWEYRAIKYIAAPCLESSGTNKDKLRQCISSWKGNLFSVPGEAHFDKTGQLIQQSILVEVGKGSFQAFKGK
ncbi:MAG: ABC transporter substrate-binding protein [Burkholderiales bacterium]|nr:ABC transporter substrate-binding protein [Burkholderiales bacterium]